MQVKFRTRNLSIISLIIGLALFVYLLKQSGTVEILARVRATGIGFLLILALSLARQLARTYAWLRCLEPEAQQPGFWQLWGAKLAGDALADLTAAGPILGEPVKIVRLKNKLSITTTPSAPINDADKRGKSPANDPQNR